MSATDYNYAALAVSIIKSVPPEQAFELLECPDIKSARLTVEDIEDMILLKKTHSYREIGEMYGMTDTAVYRRIKTYKQKQAKDKRHVAGLLK